MQCGCESNARIMERVDVSICVLFVCDCVPMIHLQVLALSKLLLFGDSKTFTVPTLSVDERHIVEPASLRCSYTFQFISYEP